MVAPWNPSAPGVLGLEWRPLVTQQWQPVIQPIAQRIRSRSAETITKLRWPVRGTTTTRPHMMIVDIYENGQETNYGNVITVEYAPNADTFTNGWRRNIDGGTTNLFDQINHSPVHYPPDNTFTDQGIITDTGIPEQYRCRVASGAFPLTVRVMRMKMRYVIAAGGYEWRDTDARLYWAGAGGPTVYNIPGSHVTTHLYGKLVELDLGEINPRTLAPWTPQDVRDFSTASGWELRIEGVGNVQSVVRLLMLGLQVTYSSIENRKAAAIWRRPPIDMSIPRAIESDRIVTLPGGTADWAKANAIDYTFVHRLAWDPLVQYNRVRSNDTFFELVTDPGPSLREPRIGGEESYADVPIPGMAAAVANLDGWGRVLAFNSCTNTAQTSSVDGCGLSPTRLLAMLLVKAAGVSEDSQPYGFGGNVYHPAFNKVYTGVSNYQSVVPGTTTSYIGVDFIVRPPAQDNGSTLTVQITTTGGTPVGGSLTLTRAQVLALQDIHVGFRRVRGLLSSGASLTSATTYRVTFSSNAANFENGWEIGTAGAPDSLYTAAGVTALDGDLATFQGATGGTWQGTADSAIDLMVTLIQQPATPVATASVLTITDDEAPFPGMFCDAGSAEVPRVTWTASAYSNFSRWEVQREEADALGLWTHVVNITSESQKSYVDYGARRGVPVRYRVRGIQTSDAFSEWGTTSQVIPRAKGSEIILTSDADPSLTVVINRGPTVRYDFLNAEEDTFVSMAGVPYQTVFSIPHERGVRFEYDLLVNLVQEPDEAGVAVFDALRRLATSQDIPYIIVLDYEGERFYTHMQVTSGTRTQPGNQYRTTATFTEVTDTPVVITQP